MKNLKKNLQAVHKELKALAKRADSLIVAVDKLEKSKPAKPKPVKKTPVKKAAVKKTSPMEVTVIYRRFKIGARIQGIEIELVEKPSKPVTLEDLFNGKSILVGFMGEEEDALIYGVEIPKILQVKPQDLRMFAYNHETVASFVRNCVSDNYFYSSKYRGEQMNEELLNSFKQDLFVALQDLNSVLDLKSVDCSLSPIDSDSYMEIEVKVMYETKNGQLTNLFVKLSRDM